VVSQTADMEARRDKVKEKIPASKRWKSIMGPVVRIVFATFLVGVAVAASQVAVKLLRDVLSLGGSVPTAYYLVYLIVSVLVAYLTYWAYVRVVEKRSVTELSGAGAPSELGIGVLVGLGMVTAIVGTLWLLGYYQITGVNAWTVAFVLLANDGAGAFVEEIILRGTIFRITEEQLGTWIALGISVVLFSLLHLSSPGVTVMSTLMVGLEAGLLLSATYVLTRTLWLAIGIHFAWDFSQDAVFGVASGIKGLVRTELKGPALLTGGTSGIEGSVLALLACLAVGAYLLLRAGRKGDFVRPFWRQHDVFITTTGTKVTEL
jgi:membrane protease YdiL (CAAX protease family)